MKTLLINWFIYCVLFCVLLISLLAKSYLFSIIFGIGLFCYWIDVTVMTYKYFFK